MTTSSEIENDFKRAVGAEIEVVAQGIDRYIVHTPFSFDDGDHYVILLKREGDRWYLSDEGHTFMHLSYELPEFDKGTRRSVIDRLLSTPGVEEQDGEIRLPIPNDRYGDSLFSFLQVVTRITDVSFLSREKVKSTFLDDFRELISVKAQDRKVDFTYVNREHDPDGRYPVDARVNGTVDTQVLVFAIANDDQCQYATIALYRWEQWEERFQSIAVFRDQTEIGRDVLARFSDVAGKQYSTLDTAKERLPAGITSLI